MKKPKTTSTTSYFPIFSKDKTFEVSAEEYLKTPQIFVDKTELGFSVTYNPELSLRIRNKIMQLSERMPQTSNLDKVLSQLLSERLWIEEQQVAVVKYLS